MAGEGVGMGGNPTEGKRAGTTGPARGGRRTSAVISDDVTGDVRTPWDPKNVEQSSS